MLNLGCVLTLVGNCTAAHVALKRGLRLFSEQSFRQWEGVTSVYLAERARALGDLLQARMWADRSWELAAFNRFERDFVRAALIQGKVAFAQGDMPGADGRLHHALIRARAINAVEFELQALVAIAELQLTNGNLGQAKTRLDDVWDAADRGPYPLHKADAYNVLAEIELAEGDKPAAIDAATKAYKAAWCDGPPYAYHWGLQKAKAHLATLGAPEPEMPPFDESKFEPLPEVEINPKNEYWVDPDKLD
ncbi:MAG: hypothetical protein QOD09_1544 [Bradyrhizobium sp.]|nr:hypothetical protein [Bradyrhizobium sp.]MEA2951842.1 hypothetical protein [Alphaproteobacteria bacterium]